MHMEDNQLESAATGSERVDTDGTTLIEGVEPSSFRAEGDQLACPTQKFNK